MIQLSMNFLYSQISFFWSHIFTDIKGFLTDVKPALLSALDVEYQKNPFEVSLL